MINELPKLYARDLDKLSTEILSYKSDAVFWKVDEEIKNSGGNLSIHIVGNLNHFIGAVLGNSGYIRERDKEFGSKNVPRKQIIDEIKTLKSVVVEVFSTLTKKDLEKIYPIPVFGEEMTTAYFLMHLFGHLNYHLGQINYHRRLLDR